MHNGIVNSNTIPTLNEFIQQEFPNGLFERWDIYKLTELFSKYLFDEYLLTDSESIRLFKRTLVLLDAPDNNFDDFKILVNQQFTKLKTDKPLKNKRGVINLFATLKLLSVILLKYSKDNNNLHPAKLCINFLILRTWAWILEHNLESNKNIISKFDSLVVIHYKTLHDYIDKTLPLASIRDGLFAYNSSAFETIGYPLRCFNYLNDLIYFFNLSNAYQSNPNIETIIRGQKEAIKRIIGSNQGCTVPLLDNHSIGILNVVYFMLHNKPNQDDMNFTANYIFKIVNNIRIIYRQKNRLPELLSNELELAKSIYKKSNDYNDKSSLLITILFELLCFFDDDLFYKELKKMVDDSKVDLQVIYPINSLDIEQILFEKKLFDEFSVEVSVKIPDTLNEFKNTFRKTYKPIEYRTVKANYGFLLMLAHIHFKTEFFPDFCNVGFCIKD